MSLEIAFNLYLKRYCYRTTWSLYAYPRCEYLSTYAMYICNDFYIMSLFFFFFLHVLSSFFYSLFFWHCCKFLPILNSAISFAFFFLRGKNKPRNISWKQIQMPLWMSVKIRWFSYSQRFIFVRRLLCMCVFIFSKTIFC